MYSDRLLNYSSNRSRLCDLPHRHLHGNVLQHHHRLGSLLLLRIFHQRASVDVLWQPVEYDQLRGHHEYDE